MVTAFTGGPVHTFDPATRRWEERGALLIDGERVVSLDARDIGVGVHTIDLGGSAIVPAFADGHVHLTDTGLKAGDRDFSSVRGLASFERRISALPRSRFIIAGNYDDARWTDGASANARALEATHGGALAMLVRVDAHSCIVTRAALAFADIDPATPGIERDAAGEPTGRLFLEANWRVQAALIAALPASEKRAADKRASALALREGALHLHVQLVGLGSREAYAAEIEALHAAGGAKWYPKICERDPHIAHLLGLKYTGGDVFLDGSIGSATAAVSEPYCDRSGTGVLMMSDDEIEAYFAMAEQLGISAGVHAIGDRAIEQCIATWERVLGGKPSPRNRHFIEHFEIARPDHIERCARLGLYLSMQPQFDAAWGSPGGLYETRLGAERAHTMNRLKSALRAGAVLVGGDDSPVCALSPLAGMRAATEHYNESERLSVGEAMTMYTYDAARFGHVEDRMGTLQRGFAADFVLLEGDPFAARSFADVRVRELWSNGARIDAS
ncbi:MAG: amidohydrolase [Candidatus Velthaea sp.]